MSVCVFWGTFCDEGTVCELEKHKREQGWEELCVCVSVCGSTSYTHVELCSLLKLSVLETVLEILAVS